MGTESIKSTTRQILARAYYTTRHYLTRLRGKVLILNYHRILPQEILNQSPPVQAGMYVRDDVFEEHIRFLAKHFSLLSIAELLVRWKENTLNSENRYCAITFDDGWLDNYLYAFPILKRYDVPATIFLPTALIGTEQWFWPDKLTFLLDQCLAKADSNRKADASQFLQSRFPWMSPLGDGTDSALIDGIIEKCKTQPLEEIKNLLDNAGETLGIKFPVDRVLMDWGEVDEMSRKNISFGSHSCTHRILTTLAPKEVQAEVEESFHTLRSRCENVVPVLAYPNGDYDSEIADRVRAAGYQAALSTRFGYEGHSPKDLFALSRVGVHQDISATTPLFALHIAGGNQILGSS